MGAATRAGAVLQLSLSQLHRLLVPRRRATPPRLTDSRRFRRCDSFGERDPRDEAMWLSGQAPPGSPKEYSPAAGRAAGRLPPMNVPVSNSLREYARGIAGGLMFSLPLLYTMEVWWTGFVAQPIRLLIYIAATFVLLLGYNHYAGLHQDASWSEVVIDSVEEMGLGLVVAGVVLFLLGQLESDMAAYEIIGKITVEAMTVAIGISVGTSQLGGGDDKRDKAGAEASAKEEASFVGQLVIAACGAMLFAANVAPTEEIIMIATEARVQNLLGLAALSLLLTALILYYIEFAGSGRFVRANGVASVIVGTVVTYAVALVVSAGVLWFFGRLDEVTMITAVAQTIVLGFAATLGASAGRLLLQ
jgi:putative integral membrane protein (TIGR02587 family)